MSIEKLSKFRPWVQKVMPQVFDDSLTYYELLNKVVAYLNQINDQANEMIDFMDTTFAEQSADITEMRTDFNTFREDMNEAYLKFTNDINNVTMPASVESVLDTWFDSGKLANIINQDVFDMKANKKEVTDIVINVKSYGAKGDGVTDDADAIQSAIDYLMSVQSGELFFPAGNYMISKQLNCYGNGRYVRIRGTGKRESFLIATAPMGAMLKTWADGIYTQCDIYDLGFKMGVYADIGIDGYKAVYSTYERISVWSSKTGSVLVKLSSWCNRLKNSMLMGDYEYTGNPLGIRPVTALLVQGNQSSTNNLIIEENVLQCVDTGIKLADWVNDIHILKNTFDHVGKVIVAQSGIKHGTFHYNYCEVVGGANNTKYDLLPVTYTDGNYSRSLDSAFILHENVSMSTFYSVNFDIAYNQFANCYKEKLVSVSCAKSFKFRDNTFYGTSGENGTYTYSKVINVFGKGIGRALQGLLNVENKHQEITDFVVYDNNYGAYYYNDGEVIIKEKAPTTIIKNTLKPRKKARLAGVAITDDQELIVNTTNVLVVDYSLSDYDAKHPHKVLINVEKVTGTKLTYSLYESTGTNLAYELDTATSTSVVGIVRYSNEISTNQKKNFYINLKSDGDVKIKSVFLMVANWDNHLIQLV